MNLFEDTYKTIAAPSEGIFKDKGSKFIAYAFPFNEEAQLKDMLMEVKSIHPKARHHCYAYRLSTDRSVFRINDDGEPSGTAGRPILNVLLSQELTNILVVVVRYFGGTLLGVPGLINAYKNATVEALSMAEKVEKTVNDYYLIHFDYSHMNDVMRIVKEENIQISKQEFDNRCAMDIEMRQAQVNRVLDKLNALRSIKVTYINTR